MQEMQSFTLIELLIVLVIIGILATLAVPKFEVLIINMRGIEAMNNLRALDDSVWRYYQETGHFPPNGPLPYYIPLDIDVKLFNNPSKYFEYSYANFDSEGIDWANKRLQAVDQDTVQNGPAGAIYAYFIGYSSTQPFEGYVGEKLDNKWYKWYYYTVKTDDIDRFKVIQGWPGRRN